MNPFFVTDFSISDSLKTVRKSVLIYETIIAVAGLIFPTSGEVIIDGKVLHKEISFPKDMGVIIENMELMPQYDVHMTI